MVLEQQFSNWTNAQAVRLSPLHSFHQGAVATIAIQHNWQVATAFQTKDDEIAAAQASLVLADLADQAKVIVEGKQAESAVQSVFSGPTLAINQGLFLSEANLSVYRLRQDQFYIRARTGRESRLIEQLNSAIAQKDDLVTVTDETDARCELLLLGPTAAICLSRVCGLDLHPDEFPNHTAKQTSVAKIRQLIIRHDFGSLPAYILSGGRSYALYLWETLLQAGRDLKIQPIGRGAVDVLYDSVPDQ